MCVCVCVGDSVVGARGQAWVAKSSRAPKGAWIEHTAGLEMGR